MLVWILAFATLGLLLDSTFHLLQSNVTLSFSPSSTVITLFSAARVFLENPENTVVTVSATARIILSTRPNTFIFVFIFLLLFLFFHIITPIFFILPPNWGELGKADIFNYIEGNVPLRIKNGFRKFNFILFSL